MSREWTVLKNLMLSRRCVYGLGQCKIDDSGAKLIGTLKWPNLQRLDLGKFHLITGSNSITSSGIKNLLSQ